MSTRTQRQNAAGPPKQSKPSTHARTASQERSKIGVRTPNSKTASSTSTASQKRPPMTPTSTRVSKTQYFPDKSLYCNALKTSAATTKINTSVPNKITAISTKPRKTAEKVSTTVVKAPKPSLAEVKKEMREKLKQSSMHAKSSKSSSEMEPERPRTATLKRPSIVNTNVAGPDAKKMLKVTNNTEIHPPQAATLKLASSVSSEMPLASTEDDYEEDFDSYASDFEEYKSSQEDSSDNMNISTDGEVTSSTNASDLEPGYIHPHNPGVILMRRGGSAEEERKLDSGNFELPTEETKHIQVLARIKENDPVNLMSSFSDEGFEEAKMPLQFVNFTEARKQCQSARRQTNAIRRGKELMSMIKLDQQNFTLFDLPAQNYEEFIHAFGNRNSVQVASQTGDDRVEVDVQTNPIRMVNKWTQFPIDKISFDKSTNPLQFRSNLRGVGGDNLEVNVDELKAYVGQYNEYNLARFLLTQEKIFSELLTENRHDKIEMSPGKFPFSEGYFVIDTSAFTSTTLIAFSATKRNPKMITVHAKGQDLRTHAFVWSLLKPTIPEDTFTAFGDICDISFSLDNDKIIFGGFRDGCLAVWDLLQDTPNHYVRPPSYLSTIECGHVGPIVKVIPFHNAMSHDLQIATLDEGGTVIIWGLILQRTRNLGLSRVSLVLHLIINLPLQYSEMNLLCTDLCLNQLDPNHLYISTNYGWIIHSLTTGARATPRRYTTGVTGPVSVLEACPHNANYFIAGSSEGELFLLCKQFEKPLMTISNQDTNAAIINIQWSFNRPCIFYTQDANNNINIWDLSVSDLFPRFSVHLKDQVKQMRLLQTNCDVSYLGLITGDGIVHLHLLNQEHSMQSLDTYNEDIRKLNSYMTRL